MTAQFDLLPWHDAELKEIIINRERADVVKIIVEWPEYERLICSIIEFYGCYGFQADMHFGFRSPDSILDANIVAKSNELTILRSNWKKMGVNLDHIHQYQIVTNTTNSTINVFCSGFRLL